MDLRPQPRGHAALLQTLSSAYAQRPHLMAPLLIRRKIPPKCSPSFPHDLARRTFPIWALKLSVQLEAEWIDLRVLELLEDLL
jgi:hypothetical protein